MSQKAFQTLSWSLFIGVIFISQLAWMSTYRSSLGDITAYQLFPLFGIIAWMVMWTHYIVGSIKIRYPDLKKPKYYSTITGFVVLFTILLHPGILAFKQFQNDQGLPPSSYYNYVGESMKIAVLLGSISLLIFLSFEVFNRLKDRQIIRKKWWLISLSQSIAMTLIFVHALRLGGSLGPGWFMWVWVCCGIALIPCFYIIHKDDFSKIG
jgi:hypothetical protein